MGFVDVVPSFTPSLLPLTLGGNYLVIWAPAARLLSPRFPIWSPEPNPVAVPGRPLHLHPNPD